MTELVDLYRGNLPGGAQRMNYRTNNQFDWNNGGTAPDGFLGDLLGNTFSGPKGMLGGFGTLAGFGSNLMNMYGGWKQAQLAQDMWDTQKDYLSMNSWNQGVLADERRAKQRVASNSARGLPVDRSYATNPEKLRRKI